MNTPPRDNAAPGAVHKPADIGCQLLRFGARQDHAVVQRMQKTPLADPALPVNHFFMHDGYLSGRPAKADKAEFQPEQKCLLEGDGRSRRGRIRQNVACKMGAI